MMQRVCRFFTISGILSMLLLMTVPVHSKPWLQVESIPASQITWKVFFGTVGDNKKRIYSLLAQRMISIPGLSGQRVPADLEPFIQSWLAAHPKAKVVPIEAYPFFSKSAAMIYVWIVDGNDNLNIDLVREGFFRANDLVPMLQTADILISAETLVAFRKMISAAEINSAKTKKGLWGKPKMTSQIPPGTVGPPGHLSLARLEGETEVEDNYKPPPTFDSKALEKDLIRIGDGDDNGASWAALKELDRRAKSDNISAEGFNTLIQTGLARQADPKQNWRHFYGNYIELAFTQGLLSEKQFSQYLHHAIWPQFKAKYFSYLTPPVSLRIVGGDRVGIKNKKDNLGSHLLLSVSCHLEEVKIDGIPVETLAIVNKQTNTYCRQLIGGNQYNGFNVMPGQELTQGLHKLTAKFETRVMEGQSACRAAQNRLVPEGDIPRQSIRQWKIDLTFIVD